MRQILHLKKRKEQRRASRRRPNRATRRHMPWTFYDRQEFATRLTTESFFVSRAVLESVRA